jgi:hypothetical protein
VALDTAAKRLSMLNFGSPVISPSALILPDGEIDQGDSQSLLWGYSGILWPSEFTPYSEIISFSVRKKDLLTFSVKKQEDTLTYEVSQ